MRSEDEIINMFALRVKGATLQEIGNEYGITRERVRQILRTYISKSTSMKRGREGIIFPNISLWLSNNKVSMQEFGTMIQKQKGFNGCKNSGNKVSNRLKGKGQFTLQEVEIILKITGMTFEEAFKREIQNDKCISKAGD